MAGELVSGRHSLRGVALDRLGRSFAVDGCVELVKDGSVKGSLADGAIIGGAWDGMGCSFTMLYNGCVPFEYDLRERTWRLESGGARENLADDETGTLEVDLECVETAAEVEAREASAADLGNHACDVRHLSSLSVPCCACDADDGSSRLAFFELVVPQFGRAEVASFHCAACGYKHNTLRTTEPARPKGRTLDLVVARSGLLGNVVVVSDAATVFCEALDLEMSVGAGRYTTVEGLLRGCVAALKNAGLASSSSSDDGGEDSSGSGVGAIVGFEKRVDELLAKGDFAIRVTDPLGLSFVAGATCTDWDRTPEQDEEFGLVRARTVPTEPSREPSNSAPPAASAGSLEDTKHLMRACEALAAEFTREYRRDEDDSDGGEDGDGDGGGPRPGPGGLDDCD